MSSILLDYGKGTGDHIRFSGIVREYCKQYDTVGVFCTSQSYGSISSLFGDLQNINIHIANTAADRKKLGHYDRILTLGAPEESGVQVERAIYAIAGVPFERRWSSFYLERDAQKEQAAYDALAPKGPYIFLHDDARYAIDPLRIDSTLPRVRPDPDRPLFDHCLLIENAEEVHVIHSSFMELVDHVPFKNPAQKIFLHNYSRPMRKSGTPILAKPWHILE